MEVLLWTTYGLFEGSKCADKNQFTAGDFYPAYQRVYSGSQNSITTLLAYSQGIQVAITFTGYLG